MLQPDLTFNVVCLIRANYFVIMHMFRGINCHNSYLKQSVKNLMKSTNLPLLNFKQQ